MPIFSQKIAYEKVKKCTPLAVFYRPGDTPPGVPGTGPGGGVYEGLQKLPLFEKGRGGGKNQYVEKFQNFWNVGLAGYKWMSFGGQ